MSQFVHEAPRPSPMADQGKHWEIDPRIACQIRCTAAGMIGKAGLTHQDREDLEQELTAHLLSRLSRYDAHRAGRMTFITRLLNNAAANIIAARRMEKRDWRADVCSLDEIVEDEDGFCVPLAELLDAKAGDGERVASIQREQMELRMDLERVIATLPENMKQLCTLLLQKNSGQTARCLGLPRASLYDLTIKLRERFDAAGLKKYL